MKEEELIKKLTSVDLPIVDMEDHRSRLRAALLTRGHQARKHQTTIGEFLALRLLVGRKWVARVIKSPQPAWKVSALTAGALALVFVLVFGVKMLTSESPAAMAANIARESPEVQEALADSDFRIMHVEVGTIPTVTFEDSAGHRVVVAVDLESRKVTSVTRLSASDMQAAIDIAMTETSVQQLIVNGARFTDVMPVFLQTVVVIRDDSGNIGINGDAIEGQVMVILERGEDRWAVRVDLAAGSVAGSLIALS